MNRKIAFFGHSVSCPRTSRPGSVATTDAAATGDPTPVRRDRRRIPHRPGRGVRSRSFMSMTAAPLTQWPNAYDRPIVEPGPGRTVATA